MTDASAQADATGNSTGLLSASRQKVYDYVREHGPCTQKELLAALAPKGKNTSTFTSRFSELADGGFIEAVGREHSGIVWRASTNPPQTRKEYFLRRRQVKAARLKTRIADLQQQLTRLETK